MNMLESKKKGLHALICIFSEYQNVLNTKRSQIQLGCQSWCQTNSKQLFQ